MKYIEEAMEQKNGKIFPDSAVQLLADEKRILDQSFKKAPS